MASIIERNGKYRAQVSVYKNGKQNRISKTFDTKKEAELWAMKLELSKGTGKNLIGQQTLFVDYFRWWINFVKKKDIKETTFQNYVHALKFVEELYPNIKLINLNDVIIQNGIDTFAETRARKTTKEFLLKVKSCLRDAYARGLLANNFTSLLKIRGEEAPKRNKILSISDMKTLRKYVLNNPETNINRMILVALDTGMRRGEILGIKKEDIYKYGIEVKRSIAPTSKDTTLKTKNSHRRISINKSVYDILIRLEEDEYGYIFNSENFKMSEKLENILIQLNLPITTFHGLRDTHASFLFSQNLDIIFISKQLGHNSIQTTHNYYLDLMPEKRHEQDSIALDLFNSLS